MNELAKAVEQIVVQEEEKASLAPLSEQERRAFEEVRECLAKQADIAGPQADWF